MKNVVVTKAPKPSNATKVITIILLIVLGAFDAAFPHLSWNLGMVGGTKMQNRLI